MYSSIVIVLWGVVGLLQKLGAARISANSLLIWLMGGYLLLLPWLFAVTPISGFCTEHFLIGTFAGLTNGLGAWYLFSSLESGAKAAVVIPLTALNPLLTILFSTIFLSETLTNLQWVGVFLAVVAGVMISCENQAEGVEVC